MRPKRTRARLLAGFALVIPAIAGADEPTKAPGAESDADAELLEFLGSLDDLDADWTEYLAQTDLAKLIKTKRPSTPKEETDD